MKKLLPLLLSALCVCLLPSCESFGSAGDGFEVPFTGRDGAPPVRLGIKGKITAVPPKLCIGLEVKDPVE